MQNANRFDLSLRIRHIVTTLIISLLFIPASLLAQEDQDFYIYGNVKDHFTRKKIDGVTVKVIQDGKIYDTQTSSSSGKYEFFLPLDHLYKVVYEKDGMVSKNVEIDTRNIPEEDRRGGFSYNTDMSLFEVMEGVDFSILEQPIGKAKFMAERGNVEFDFGYTNRIQAEVDKILRELENKKKDEEKAEDKEAQAAKKLQEDFDKLMKQGKDNMTKKSYEGAVTNFQGALDLIPDDGTAKSSLAEAKKLLDEQNAAAEAEKKYNDLIDKADGAFRDKNWESAINDYNSALDIKKGEKYPIDQITAAEKALEKEKANAANEAEVAKLISEGDGLVSKEEYQGGIDKFKEALNIISDNKEATDKLADAQKKLADWEANKEKRANFDAVIAEADGHFSGEDYENAITKYGAALDIIADDEYAKKRLKESEDLLAKQKKEADKAEEMARKQADFDKFMAAGDTGMEAKSYDTAIGSYENALGVFPDDSTAKKKLEDARKAKADAQEAMANEERYNELIKEGDKLFEKEDYEASIDQYTSALDLKKEDYPQSQIEKARKIIEELKSKEEADRLAKEAEMEAEELAKENQRRFDEFMKAGDDGMSDKDYELAIVKFEGALEIFADNAKAIDKLKKAQDARAKELADMEAADKQKAEEEAKNAALADEREKKRQFDDYITQGDNAFKANTFQPAIDSYEQALLVMPGDKSAKSKLDRAIDALKKEEDRLAKEEDRLKEQEEEDARRAAEQELQEQADSEKARLAKLNEDYDNFIRMADGFFADKDYNVAKVNYQEALDLKPGETYPATRLERIEKLLAQLEDEEALRQERLAREREEQESRDFARGNDLDQSEEDRIDADMAEARRKALQDKWNAVAADKERWKEIQASLSDAEGSRIDENVDDIEDVRKMRQDLEEKARIELEDKARNMEGYKEGLTQQDQSYAEDHAERVQESVRSKQEQADNMSQFRDNYSEEVYQKKYVEAVSDYEKSNENIATRGARVTERSRSSAEDRQKDISDTYAEFTSDANDRLKEKQEEIEETKANIAEERADTSKEQLVRTSEELEREKEREGDYQKALIETAKQNREADKSNLMNVETFAAGKSPIDYTKSELADKYPAGVTEETYEEGSSMVIRRIVVVGNKATEYRKVVSKSGTYYFKNKRSITESLWKIESDKVTE